MTLYRKQTKTSATEANLAALNSNYADKDNVFLTENDGGGGGDITDLIEAGTNILLAGSGTALDPYIISSEIPGAAQRTGTSLTFDTESFYGSIASPVSGNFSVNLAGAKLGITHIVFHNAGAEPAYPGTMVKLTGSEAYSAGNLNYYVVIYLGGTTVGYLIKQNA